jgi:hypothetical protein
MATDFLRLFNGAKGNKECGGLDLDGYAFSGISNLRQGLRDTRDCNYNSTGGPVADIIWV